MKRLALIVAFAAGLLWTGLAQAQHFGVYEPYYPTYYSSPRTVYYGAPPATTYYASAPTTAYYASAPTTVYYETPPGTTYYASAPTTVYYGSSPTTTYYASAPTTVYYGAPPPVITSYYRPLVGRGITRVGYYTPAVPYPRPTTYSSSYPWW